MVSNNNNYANITYSKANIDNFMTLQTKNSTFFPSIQLPRYQSTLLALDLYAVLVQFRILPCKQLLYLCTKELKTLGAKKLKIFYEK